MRLAAAALVAVTLAACGREETVDERCRRTIDHVKAIVAADASGAARGEKVVIGAVEIASMSVCTHEGLSPAQADCITAARDRDQLVAVGECPAIREKKPRWLVLPPKKLLRGSEPEAGEETEPRQ
jgi:hypothetical protein